MPLTLLSSEIDLLLFHHSSLPSAQFTAVFGEKAGLNGDSSHPRSTSFFSNLFVSRRAQRRHCPLQVLALDQHIMRIKRRNREDRDPRFRQRFEERCQHASHRKWEGPFEFQREPSTLDRRSVWHRVSQADVFAVDNGKFFARAYHAEKPALRRPSRGARIGGQPAHGQRLHQNAVFQILRQLRKEGYYISQPTRRRRAGRPARGLAPQGRARRPSLHRGTRSRFTASLRPSARSGISSRQRTKRSFR